MCCILDVLCFWDKGKKGQLIKFLPYRQNGMKIKALIFFILEPFLIVVYEGKYLLPSKFSREPHHVYL